jgi:hypothetical protein
MNSHPQATLLQSITGTLFARNAAVLAIASLLWGGIDAGYAPGQSDVTLEISDELSGEPCAARIEFLKSAKRIKADRKILTFGDTWLAEDSLKLQPSTGDFEFMARRGPEFKEIRGGFTIEGRAKDIVSIPIPRAVDMHAESWFSGDMGCEWDPQQSWRWQVADAIDMVVQSSLAVTKAPVAAKPLPSKRNAAPETSSPEISGYRWQSVAREFRSPQLGLAMHRIPMTQGSEATRPNNPESIAAESDADERLTARLPSAGPQPASAHSEAYRCLHEFQDNRDCLGELTQLTGRDVPILLAFPNVRWARVLNQSNRPRSDDLLVFPKGDASTEFARLMTTLGKDRIGIPILAPFDPKDRVRYKGPRGAGMVAEQVYWQMLEAGLRMTPTAASPFGRLETHLGYNRVYAYIASDPTADGPTADGWWRAVQSGATFVSNGPLLRALVNGLPPGSVQAAYRGESIPLDIAVSLAVREPVDYLDVVFNGETLYSAKLEDHYRKGEFPELNIRESGWMVIRVVTGNEDGYRMASTAPFYFEFEGKPRVSRKAVAFFQTWLERSEAAIQGNADIREPYRELLTQATRFWTAQRERSTAP